MGHLTRLEFALVLGRHHAACGRAGRAPCQPPPRLPARADRPADHDERHRRPASRGDGRRLARLQVVAALDREDKRGERLLGRIGAPIAKYWICKRAVSLVDEALECHGGNGFIEDHLMARLYREAPLNGIWEGSGNVICLDVLRSMAREPDCVPALLDEIAAAKGQDPRLDAAIATSRATFRIFPATKARPGASSSGSRRSCARAFSSATRRTRWRTPMSRAASKAPGPAPTARCRAAPRRARSQEWRWRLSRPAGGSSRGTGRLAPERRAHASSGLRPSLSLSLALERLWQPDANHPLRRVVRCPTCVHAPALPQQPGSGGGHASVLFSFHLEGCSHPGRSRRRPGPPSLRQVSGGLSLSTGPALAVDYRMSSGRGYNPAIAWRGPPEGPSLT